MTDRLVRVRGHYEEGLLILRSTYARYPVSCRPDTSDPLAFCQIFVDREYDCVDDVTQASLIVDCGANVGYSAAYFMSRFPSCDLVAVEPDPNNFQLLCRNLAPYGKAARAIQTAVWSRPARLAISETKYRDGREWARQVRECKADEEAGFLAVDIGGLLAESRHPRISILKMDVEGAEAVIFSEHVESWIDQVDCMVIELHDDSTFGNASSAFAKAIAGRRFSVTRSGELTVCKRSAELR